MAPLLLGAYFSSPLLCAATEGLRTLTTAGETHALTTEEARRNYPVHVRGLVTCVDPSTGPGHSAIFVHDATGTIYVMFEDKFDGAFPSGTMVDVQGVTGPGTAAPIVDNTRITVIGRASLPENPPLDDLFHLETGGEDGKWVEVEGTVHSVFVHERGETTFRYVTLQLAMVGGSIGVSMLWEPGADYTSLIDSRVRIRGNAAPMFNGNDQIIGARLMAPGLSTVRVLERSPNDPFRQPTTLIDDLLRWNLISTSHHRVHLRGKVTLQWPGTSLCIQDATRGICAQTTQDTRIPAGGMADVVGFPESANGTPVLTDAEFRSAGNGQPFTARTIPAGQAMLGKVDSELVTIEGRLIGSDLTSSDITLLLNSGNLIFTAILPKSLASADAGTWTIGSRLRVTGICSVRLDVQSSAVGKGIAVAKSFRVLMRSPRDVDVVERPSWWTAGRAASLLGILLVAIVGAVGWITRLRARVRTQLAALNKARREAEAIDELARAMQQVTAQRNLTARVSASGSEQIAQLGIGFNRMLSELEEGDLAKKAAESRLQQQALTDELTGLPNRRSLSEKLEQSIDSARVAQGILGVLFIDLDGFKSVNDTLGHAAGDLLLVEVSRRLKSRIRHADTLARLGGDEFTILLSTIRTTEEAAAVATNLLDVLGAPLLLDGHEVTIGASIGISLFPQDGADPAYLLQCADTAMYAAKGNGKNQIRCFTQELGSSVCERVNLENQLRGAVVRGEIHLVYQPEFNLISGHLIRFEALARWTHPHLGIIPPGKFIPIAEESGQIVALGAYVMRQACLEAVKWQALAAAPVQVAVNVSSIEFTHAGFVEQVARTLEETGLRPELLQIELTESLMLIGAERAGATMKRLRALGVSLALDDFGTGYSCLSYLPNLPFDVLKIDQSFVRELPTRFGTQAVVSCLIALAHSLKMQVVVEGIETTEQLEIIRALNGNEIQGFLVGRPVANPQSTILAKERSAKAHLGWGPKSSIELLEPLCLTSVN